METKVVCIYHSRDLDGWMSAAIVKLNFGDIALIGWDYGMPIPDLSEFNMVVMVDISFPKEKMREIGYTHTVVWIDHHASAIRDSIEWSYTIYNGIRDDKYAACELTWMHYFPNEKMPELVRLLGRYDCFRHKGTDEEIKVLEFQYGARQLITNTDEAFWQLMVARGRGDWTLDADLCDDIHLQGKAIYKYLCSDAKQIYKRRFDVEFNTRGNEDRDWTSSDKKYKFACVNQERFNPVNFGINYHDDGYDGFACFHYANGKFNYSLYNDNKNVDCSIIAKGLGGGGHKGASGFISDKILF